MNSPLRFSLAWAVLPWIALPAARAASMSWDPAVSAGTALGGSGVFSNTATDLFWWTGTSNAAWTDTVGVDIAILDVTPVPDPDIYNTNTVTIPAGTTLAGNGITFATNGFTVAGPGTFNFRNNTATATAPATLTVPAGITGTFTAGNNQNNATLPPITITGGGTLRWGTTATGSKISLEGGTLVECIGTSQVLGGGTNHINHGTLRYSAAGAADLIYNSANFTGPAAAGSALGTIDLNGRTEVIGSIAGNFNITNTGAVPATVILAGTGTPVYTGVISDHPADPAISTALTLTGTNVAAGTNFTSAGNVLGLMIGRPQTYTGNTTLQRGTLTLDFNNANHPGTADLLYNGAPPFTRGRGTGSLVFATNPPDGTEAGTGGRSILAITGKANAAVTQRFNGLVLQPNASGGLAYNLPTGGTAATSTATIELGEITRGPGSAFNLSGLGTNGLTLLTPTGSAGKILEDHGTAWMTVAGSDWVAKDPTNTFLVPATNFYTPTGPDSLTDHANFTSGTDVRLTADTTIRSLRHNLNERRTVDLNRRTLTLGSILIGSAAATSGSSITGGHLTSTGRDLLLVHTAAANYRYYAIGATLTDNPAGPVGFTKSGTGGTLLTGHNTNTGNLVVAQGVLILTGTNTPSSVLINGNTANTNGGQLPVNVPGSSNLLQLGNAGAGGSLSAASATGVVPITIGALSAFAVKRSDDLTFSNEIRGSGHFIQAGTGTTTFDGPAARYGWRGDTIVSAGVLNLDYSLHDAGKISDFSILRLSGGTVRLSGGGHTEVLASLTLASGLSRLERAGATGRFRLNTINGLGTTTAAGTAGAALNLAESGIADTDTPNTNNIIGAGARVIIAGSDWAVNSTNTGDGPVVAFTGYTPLATTAGTDTAHSGVTAAMTFLTGSRTTGTLRISSAGGSRTLDLGTGNILTLTSGGMLLTGSQPITFNNGTFRSGTAVAPELIIHNHAGQPVTFNSTLGFGTATTGQTHLNLAGPGTTVLTAINRYGGNTHINGGTAVITSGANLGGANGVIGIEASATNSATVTLTSAALPPGFGPGSRLLGQTVNSITGTTVTLGGNATTALAAGSTAAWATGNAIILNRGTLKVDGTISLTETNPGGTGGTATLNRTLTLHGSGGTVEVTAGNTLSFAGATNGPGGLTKTGTGTLVCTSGSGNTATGPTVIEAGTLRTGTNTALSFYSNCTVGPNGTLDINGTASGANQTIGSLAGSGLVTNHGAAASTLITGAIHQSTVFAGLIRDGSAAVHLAKIGTGTLTLTGANPYTGTTLVEAGGLVANNTTGSATGSGPITIRRVGFLAGTGSMGGAVTLQGTLSPGDPAAPDTTDDLAFGSNLTCQTNSGLLFEIGGNSTGTYDRILAAGTVTMASQQDVTLSFVADYTPAPGHVFDLIDAAELIAPEVVFTLPGLSAGLVWNTERFATDGTVSFTTAAANLYNTWLNSHFTAAEQLDPALSGPHADPDSDGLANAIEFAAGTLPRDAASGGAARLPVLSVSPAGGFDYATLTFTASTAHLPGITITGQSGTAPGAWPDGMPLVGTTPNGDGTTTLVFRSTTATTVPVRRFYRLYFAPLP